VGGLAAIPDGATTFGDTGDYTISPTALDSITAGSITLRANNDITVDNGIHLTGGVGLSLLAGRNLTLNTEINFFQASVTLTANAATGLGVDQANRDPGDAALTLVNGILNSSTTGTATLTGDVGDRAGANLHPNAPVLLLGSTQIVNGGAVISGQGNASQPIGILVTAGSVITATGDFDIDLTGTASNNNNFFQPGVDITGAVTTAGGDITVRGTATGGGESSYGINVAGASARVRASGDGAVTLIGRGGTGDGSFGIEILGDNASATPIPIVETVNGILTLDGVGGGSEFRTGVSIEQRALVRATGSGDIVINGHENGISFDPFGGGSGFVSLGTGNLTLTGDVLVLDESGSVTAEGPGSRITYQPSTPSRPIRLGGGSTADRLVFNDTSRAAITGFREIVIGRDDGSGPVDMDGVIAAIDADLAVRTPLNLAGGIVVSRTLDVGVNALTLVSGSTITRADGGLLKGSVLVLRAERGLGSSGIPLLTQAANLEVVSATGGVFLGNTGDLRLGPIGLQVTGTAGDIAVSTTGNLAIDPLGGAVRGPGDIHLQATGALGIDRDIASTGNGKRLTFEGAPINVRASTLSGGTNGRMTFEGNTTLAPATTIAAVLDPATVGGLPLIQAIGSINLGGANLRATGPGGIPPGATITLIDNDGTEAVTGTFAQGTNLVVAGEGLQLLYAAGDGNNVEARRPVQIPPARPVEVRLVRKQVGRGRRAQRILFLDVIFIDNGQLKTEIRSPFQPSRFRNIRVTTTADTDQNGVIDSVTLSGQRGRQTQKATLSV
jgi:hypothetical protein